MLSHQRKLHTDNNFVQRAFRQRKEGYIKKLEEQVRDYNQLNENYKFVQAENYQLRDYIINLQSRLLESQGEFPQPPGGIDGLHPGNKDETKHPLPTQAPPRGNGIGVNAINTPSPPQFSSNPSNPPPSTFQPGESPHKRARSTTLQEMNAAQEALQGMKNDMHRLPPRVEAGTAR